MTYHRSNGNDTILVSRQGYAGLGATDDEKIKAGCTPLERVASAGTTPALACEAKVKASATGSGGTLSKVGDFFGTLLSGAVNSFAAAKGGAGQQQPVIVPAAGPSPLVIAAAVGGIGLLAFMIMRKPRPTTNPRHRRRARSRRRGHRASRRR